MGLLVKILKISNFSASSTLFVSLSLDSTYEQIKVMTGGKSVKIDLSSSLILFLSLCGVSCLVLVL